MIYYEDNYFHFSFSYNILLMSTLMSMHLLQARGTMSCRLLLLGIHVRQAARCAGRRRKARASAAPPYMARHGRDAMLPHAAVDRPHTRRSACARAAIIYFSPAIPRSRSLFMLMMTHNDDIDAHSRPLHS